MLLDIAAFIVNTMSCLAFIVTAYYAFAANRDSAKLNEQTAEKDKKTMEFYQNSLNETSREKRLDDMVAYVQEMLSRWSMKTPAFRSILKNREENNGKASIEDFDFVKKRISDDDIYFDGVNLTFWRCILNLSLDLNGNLKKNDEFADKVVVEIEKYRKNDLNFDAIIRILLSDFNDLTGTVNQKMQFYQCFRHTNTIYECSSMVNKIISCLYTNKISRRNLMAILKHRIPILRENYDAELNRILGISNS